jgi:nitrogen-specific signal transduction histidine kinase
MTPPLGCMKLAGRAQVMAEENKIPLELVKQLRVLAHDLSNALEAIVQATYLLSQANPPENTRRWVHLIEQSSQEAVRLNQKLREILRSQTL